MSNLEQPEMNFFVLVGSNKLSYSSDIRNIKTGLNLINGNFDHLSI